MKKMGIERLLDAVAPEQLEKARGFRGRIAGYENPVEYVNNMYGSHPDQGGDYFDLYRG